MDTEPKLQKHRRKQPRLAILEATLSLLFEDGYQKLTIERIAERAQVSRQTIYRWWSSKGAVVLEAYTEEARNQAPGPDTGSLYGDLKALLGDMVSLWEKHPDAPKAMIAESQVDPEFMKLWSVFALGRREVVGTILRRAIQRREIPTNTNTELIIDLFYGPAWYRLLLGQGALDKKFIKVMIDTIMVVVKG